MKFGNLLKLGKWYPLVMSFTWWSQLCLLGLLLIVVAGVVLFVITFNISHQLESVMAKQIVSFVKQYRLANLPNIK